MFFWKIFGSARCRTSDCSGNPFCGGAVAEPQKDCNGKRGVWARRAGAPRHGPKKTPVGQRL